MFCYIHPEDQQDLINVLEAGKEELDNPNRQATAAGRYTDDIPFFGNNPQGKSAMFFLFFLFFFT